MVIEEPSFAAQDCAPRQGWSQDLAGFDINAINDDVADVSSITIRNLDPGLKEKLRVRAAEHARSMEAEARCILKTALIGGPRSPEGNLYDRIHARFARLGGVDLALPPREAARFD